MTRVGSQRHIKNIYIYIYYYYYYYYYCRYVCTCACNRQLDRQDIQASQKVVLLTKLAAKFSVICRTLRIITIFLNSLPVDSVPNMSQMNLACTHIN